MFGLKALASVLDSIDSAAKETLEEPKQSATVIRRARRKLSEQATSAIDASDDGTSTNDENDQVHGVSSSDGFLEPHAEDNVAPSPTTHSRTSSHSDINELTHQVSGEKPQIFNLPPSGSAKKAPQHKDEHAETDLKQLVRKKTKEIETLNEECIHLESQVNSLKQEVTEAWDHYKQAQERAAARESELQDEIKQIQKSKSVDKQQAVQQMTKLQEDIALLTKQLQAITEEKQLMKSKMEEYEANNEKWEEKVQKLKDDLQEARMSTIQGAQTIREDLRASQLQNEQLRNDHANIMRQMQSRQQELEQENQELMKAINDNQRELIRLKASQGQQSSGSTASSTDKSYTTEDFVTVQKELFEVAHRYEKEHELLEEKDREMKRLEREFKALQINYDDEKRNSQDLTVRLNEALQKFQTHGSLLSDSAIHSADSIKPDAKVEYENTIADLKKQAESLSQLLLKRQASVLELQAERSSLKSRVSDLQSRCTQLEQQLASVRDLEDGGYDFDEGDSPPNSSRGSGMMRKRGNDRSEITQYRGANRVINDLEKIGVRPGVGVTKAVTVIDSWTLFTGRVLRHHPLLRLGFVMYLLMLHLWVLFILIIHTHSLEDLAPNADPKEKLLN